MNTKVKITKEIMTEELFTFGFNYSTSIHRCPPSSCKPNCVELVLTRRLSADRERERFSKSSKSNKGTHKSSLFAFAEAIKSAGNSRRNCAMLNYRMS